MKIVRVLPILLFAVATVAVLTTPEPPQTHTIFLPVVFSAPAQLTANQFPKKGVAVSQVGANCEDAARLNVGWWYNWATVPTYDCTYATGFVPMIWGTNVPLEWAQHYAARAGWLMGYNEPDNVWQANTTPTEAARGWRDIEAAFPGVRLVSPVTTQANPGWLIQMRNEYRRLYGTEPRFDAIGVHIYFDDTKAAREYIYARHLEWPDKPLWVTEYNSCLWVKNPDWRKSAELTQWMQAQPYIDRYAWFVSGVNWHPDTKSACTLLDGASALSEPGRWFAAY